MNLHKLKYKMWAKALAAVLLFIFSISFLAGAAGFVTCDNYAVYQRATQSDLQEELEHLALRKYAVIAMADYMGKSDKALGDHYQYAIYEGSGTAGKQVAGNMKGKVPEGAEVHEFEVSENSTFILPNSFFDQAFVNSDRENIFIEEQIDQLYYSRGEVTDRENVTETVEAEPVLYIGGSATDADTLYRVNPNLYRFDDKDSKVWITKADGRELGIPLSKVEELEIAADTRVISPYTVGEIIFDDYNIGQIEYGWFRAYDESLVKETKLYTVVGSVSEPAAMTGEWKSADIIEQSVILTNLLWSIRYVSIVLMVVSMVLGILMFVFLMMSAGHREGEAADVYRAATGAEPAAHPEKDAAAAESAMKPERFAAIAEPATHSGMIADTVVSGIRLLPIDRIPLDLGAFVVMILCSMCGTPAFAMWNIRQKPVMSVVMLVVCLAAAYAFALEYCMIFAVNMKVGGWWKRTLVYRMWRLAVRICKWFLSLAGRLVAMCRKSTAGIAMGKRVWGLFALFVFLEFVGLNIFRAPIFLLGCWAVEKVIFFFILAKVLRDFGMVKRAGAEIAGGNLEYKVDTDGMFTDLSEVGKSLNAIGSGLSSAVDERMKSERMKTELITNVSHDIKTPLTSIINYTDLLTRLEIEDPTAREYLEVLGRQSARLKKLIEDLIEASKAASGALKLDMESVNISMLLRQAAGEYEERLSERGLDLRISGEQEEFYVRADSRYLWRVFDNLMSNVMKYAQPGTRVYVDLKSEADEACIIFRNVSATPLNISGEELRERFVRGDSSRSTEGSGLGLSIADSLVSLMGGAMGIDVDGDLFKVTVRMRRG